MQKRNSVRVLLSVIARASMLIHTSVCVLVNAIAGT